MTRDAKLRAIAAQQGAYVVAQFPDTRRALQELARAEGRTLSVTLAAGLPVLAERDESRKVVVAERHPLREHDEQVTAWADASAGSIVFEVALDEIPLSLFHTETIRPLLEKLGMKADEPMSHGMVSSS